MMKQEFTWKKIPKNLKKIDKDLYHFLGKAKAPEAKSIHTGRLWWDFQNNYCVCVYLHNATVLIPISKFSHYAEVG